MPRYKPQRFGPLCVDLINATLELEMEHGEARMPGKVHEKIATKHADDYDVCMRNLPSTLQNPTYIGLPPKHTDKLELVKRVESGAALVLVAVALEQDQYGDYAIASTYTISEDAVDRYRQTGRMIPPARHKSAGSS